MAAKVDPYAGEKITEYLESMQPFSEAICKKLREIILSANPDILEDWKWGPNYYYKGMVCGYGAFHKHVKFTFFNGSAMNDPLRLFNHCVDNEFSRSIKYTDINEVNSDNITAYVKESIDVNKKGFKREIKDKHLEIPADLQRALSANITARKFFEGLTYGYKKEYVEWINTAKREETRNQRITKTIAMCREERTLNDKYKKTS